jgi:hypothetical protein
MRGHTGTARLAAVLQTMAQRTASSLDNDWLTLGTIQPDGSLKLDDYRHQYELGEYMVLDTLDHEVDALGRVNAVTLTGERALTTQPGGGDAHTHTVTAHDHPTIPTELPAVDERGRLVGEGDRVLCAWVNSGQANRTGVVNPRPVDVVVIGRVYWSS